MSQKLSDNKTGKPGNAVAAKAAEIQEAGSAKPGAGHPVVEEGGRAETPTEGKGQAKAAASTAVGGFDGGTSHATAGKAEQETARNAGLAKTQEGRGHRKAG